MQKRRKLLLRRLPFSLVDCPRSIYHWRVFISLCLILRNIVSRSARTAPYPLIQVSALSSGSRTTLGFLYYSASQLAQQTNLSTRCDLPHPSAQETIKMARI